MKINCGFAKRNGRKTEHKNITNIEITDLTWKDDHRLIRERLREYSPAADWLLTGYALVEEKTEAVVLDQFGDPWGIVDTDRPSGSTIDVFRERIFGGAPINTKTHCLSRRKKHFDWFKNHPETNCVEFTEYKFGGYTFYKY